ncbi:hybrid sensor histidine kinase/response regulator [Marinobacter sp.]|uniref:hybrid sensor histidine kinase/response regulator n=1 Tax=Marinobacter sp. TaxID=50741 RepID=UPI002B45DD64|nr:ATP-binding protein [Marinobacter sp.]HKK55439.1 ATP-binding protein [Marinobacter sp.]
MTTPFRKRLSFRLTRDTVLVAMLLGLVLNVAQVTLDFFSARESMEQEIEALIDISHSPASQIAYNIDNRLAKELLEGLLQHPAIVDARIIDNNGETMAAASQSSPESGYRWISDLMFGASTSFQGKLSVPQLGDRSLGHLAITIDTYHYGLLFLQRAGYTLISGLLKSLVLTLALLGIFYLSLTRPMLNVISALGRVKAEKPEKARLPVPQNHEEDEIGSMVRIINRHLETIDQALAQLRDAEAAMKNYSGKLEHEVEDRTREISEKNKALQRGNKALVTAKEDAVRRARARANFLASMSHEIRTPLNGVLGMLSLALENEAQPEQRNRLGTALSAGQSLLGLLNDILDISKVEAGKLSLETIPFSVRRIAEECATLHAQQARRKQIDVVTDIEGRLPETFLGDPTRTRQILNNLLSNAVKFTNHGHVRLEVTRSTGYLRFDIVDTGIGMSNQALDRIFSPFSQADADTTRLYGGTGLGLTLCQQLVEHMHGQITVTSEPDQGTRFSVFLPLPVAEQDPGEVSDSRIPDRLRQLGVDLDLADSHQHAGPIRSQLEAWGIPVREASPEGRGILITAYHDNDSTGGIDPDTWAGAGVLLIIRSGKLTTATDHPTLTMPLCREPFLYALCHAAGLAMGGLQDNVRESIHGDVQKTAEGHDPSSAAAGSPAVPAMRLLLVEDNHVNQLVASSMLTRLGHEVVIADEGRQALEILASDDEFDMVLMDCQMPVLDGCETTRIIRQNPAWKHLPIIATTANVMQGDRDECLESGMNDYITKPYNRRDLKAIIERWAPSQ